MTEKHPLQSMIDAPLAGAWKINLPTGRRAATRSKPADYEDSIGCPKVSAKELRERKQKATQTKIAVLFDHYATTDLTPERVAQHKGLYRNEQTGTDDKGKPTFTRVLDVEIAKTQLAWRKAQAA